ncbi:MAG: nucleotidyltransferase family protein, partial [Bacilli bacterium]|nr:nucleotidyltransferase family protein [Bacilli bacterium]
MDKELFKNNVLSFIKLLSIYLNKKEASDLVIDKDLLSFYVKLSKHHSLKAILYAALSSTKAQVNEEYLKKLEEYYLLTLRKAVLFDKERNELYEYLNNNQIDYLPLKGIILKDYYIDPYTREFADNDILFDEKKDKLVKDFFVKKDYTVELFKKSNHDVYIKEPFFNFEMHRALFGETGDNKKNIVYFKDYLSKAPIKENYEHELSNEDFYVYFTAHTYKHFHVSGC